MLYLFEYKGSTSSVVIFYLLPETSQGGRMSFLWNFLHDLIVEITAEAVSDWLKRNLKKNLWEKRGWILGIITTSLLLFILTSSPRPDWRARADAPDSTPDSPNSTPDSPDSRPDTPNSTPDSPDPALDVMEGGVCFHPRNWTIGTNSSGGKSIDCLNKRFETCGFVAKPYTIEIQVVTPPQPRECLIGYRLPARERGLSFRVDFEVNIYPDHPSNGVLLLGIFKEKSDPPRGHFFAFSLSQEENIRISPPQSIATTWLEMKGMDAPYEPLPKILKGTFTVSSDHLTWSLVKPEVLSNKATLPYYDNLILGIGYELPARGSLHLGIKLITSP